MSKISDYIEDHSEIFACIYISIVAIFLICMLIHAFAGKDLTEGMVMNKRFSQGYVLYYGGRNHFQPDRWIIEIQNGDEKDWWQVSESYYDSVKIGDWVEK